MPFSAAAVMSWCEACPTAFPPTKQMTCGDSCLTPLRSATASESGRSSRTSTSTQRAPLFPSANRRNSDRAPAEIGQVVECLSSSTGRSALSARHRSKS